MDWEDFRTGMAPFLWPARSLHGDLGSGTNTATNMVMTTDDYSSRCRRSAPAGSRWCAATISEARNAAVYLGPVPVFWWPYYHQDLNRNPNRFTFLAGDRGVFGPYLLTTYHWFWNDDLNGAHPCRRAHKPGFRGGAGFFV